jgi:hypothetical protein
MRAHLLKLVGVALAFAPVAAADAPSPKPTTEVFFNFDSSWLNAPSRAALDRAAHAAKTSLSEKLVVDGHADSRGASDYNVRLAIKRAESVKAYLIYKGVDPDMIVVTIYGEDGPRRATFAQDRRVGLALTDQPLYSIIDHALPTATAVTWRKPATTAEIEGPMREQPLDTVAGRR